jgi:hypothetical protein
MVKVLQCKILFTKFYNTFFLLTNLMYGRKSNVCITISKQENRDHLRREIILFQQHIVIMKQSVFVFAKVLSFVEKYCF